MTKLKLKPGRPKKRGMVQVDTIFPLCHRVDEEWFASITAKFDNGEPVIAIAGPFADIDEAKARNGKWLELSGRLGRLELVNQASVPAKVRQEITSDVMRGWRQGDFERLRSWQGGDDLPANFDPKN
jgi:hypothetical protein